MYDHALFVRTLSDFTRLLLTPYDVNTNASSSTVVDAPPVSH